MELKIYYGREGCEGCVLLGLARLLVLMSTPPDPSDAASSTAQAMTLSSQTGAKDACECGDDEYQLRVQCYQLYSFAVFGGLLVSLQNARPVLAPHAYLPGLRRSKPLPYFFADGKRENGTLCWGFPSGTYTSRG